MLSIFPHSGIILKRKLATALYIAGNYIELDYLQEEKFVSPQSWLKSYQSGTLVNILSIIILSSLFIRV